MPKARATKLALLVNGNDDLLRTLVSNGLPVLVETWHEDEPNDGLGHYRLLVGYDDAAQQWTLYDSYDCGRADLGRSRTRASAWATSRWPTCGRSSTAPTCWSTHPIERRSVEAILADFGVDRRTHVERRRRSTAQAELCP